MNGKSSIRPRFRAAICKMTLARFVRTISGAVNSSRRAKSDSSYSRMHTPGPTRPHRPDRWFADA